MKTIQVQYGGKHHMFENKVDIKDHDKRVKSLIKTQIKDASELVDKKCNVFFVHGTTFARDDFKIKFPKAKVVYRPQVADYVVANNTNQLMVSMTTVYHIKISGQWTSYLPWRSDSSTYQQEQVMNDANYKVYDKISKLHPDAKLILTESLIHEAPMVKKDMSKESLLSLFRQMNSNDKEIRKTAADILFELDKSYLAIQILASSVFASKLNNSSRYMRYKQSYNTYVNHRYSFIEAVDFIVGLAKTYKCDNLDLLLEIIKSDIGTKAMSSKFRSHNNMVCKNIVFDFTLKEAEVVEKPVVEQEKMPWAI